MGLKRLKNARRVDAGRAVVEGQYNFAVGQEVVFLVLLMAKARAFVGVDLNRARDTDGFWPATSRSSGLRCRWRRHSHDRCNRRHGRDSAPCADF